MNCYFEIQMKDSTITRWLGLSEKEAKTMFRITKKHTPENCAYFDWGEYK